MIKRNGIVFMVAFTLAVLVFSLTPQNTMAEGGATPPNPGYDTVDTTGSSQSVIVDESDSNVYVEVVKVLFTLILY
ncbi:MAG: hypothetical protein R3F48_09945 [Candidatus Zixiibacteriota bacterium]